MRRDRGAEKNRDRVRDRAPLGGTSMFQEFSKRRNDKAAKILLLAKIILHRLPRNRLQELRVFDFNPGGVLQADG
jgi:hypothetical protein